MLMAARGARAGVSSRAQQRTQHVVAQSSHPRALVHAEEDKPAKANPCAPRAPAVEPGSRAVLLGNLSQHTRHVQSFLLKKQFQLREEARHSRHKSTYTVAQHDPRFGHIEWGCNSGGYHACTMQQAFSEPGYETPLIAFDSAATARTSDRATQGILELQSSQWCRILRVRPHSARLIDERMKSV